MTHVERAVEIERPAAAVWPHVRVLPSVLDGVRAADEHPDGRVVVTGEDDTTWDAALVEDGSPEHATWEGLDGSEGTWRASIIALSPKRTRVDLVVEHDPHGIVERAGDALGRLDRRVEATLERLKRAVEDATPPPW